MLTYGMGYHQQRYSPLKDINKRTVKRLVPVWSLARQRVGEQAQPLVYNGVMYVTNVKRTVAIDVAPAGRSGPPSSGRPVARSCAAGSPTAALRSTTARCSSPRSTRNQGARREDRQGNLETKVAEWKEGYSITSAPTVANGVLMTGMPGASTACAVSSPATIPRPASSCGAAT